MYSFMGLVDKGVYEEQNDDRIIRKRLLRNIKDKYEGRVINGIR